MYYKTRLAFLFLFLVACRASVPVQPLDDRSLATLPHQQKTVVLNFWATWCEPCVEEIPVLIRLQKQYPKVEFIGISMDESDQLASVKKFVREHKIPYRILLRTGENFESMVNSIDPNWQGGIPATFVFRNGKRLFSKVGIIQEQELRKVFSAAP